MMVSTQPRKRFDRHWWVEDRNATSKWSFGTVKQGDLRHDENDHVESGNKVRGESTDSSASCGRRWSTRGLDEGTFPTRWGWPEQVQIQVLVVETSIKVWIRSVVELSLVVYSHETGTFLVVCDEWCQVCDTKAYIFMDPHKLVTRDLWSCALVLRSVGRSFHGFVVAEGCGCFSDRFTVGFWLWHGSDYDWAFPFSVVSSHQCLLFTREEKRLQLKKPTHCNLTIELSVLVPMNSEILGSIFERAKVVCPQLSRRCCISCCLCVVFRWSVRISVHLTDSAFSRHDACTDPRIRVLEPSISMHIEFWWCSDV